MKQNRMRTLALLFAMLSFVALVVGAVAVVTLRVILHSKQQLVQTYEEVARSGEQLQVASERRARMLRTSTIFGRVSDRDGHVEARQYFQRRLAALMDGAGGAQLHQDLEQVREIDRLLSTQEEELRSLIQSGEPRAVLEAKLLRDVSPAREEMDEAVHDVVAHADWLVSLARRDSDRSDALASSALIGTVILAFIVIGALALVLRQTLRRFGEVQEQLRQASIFQQRLMGVVGHDLRSPLAAILMSARAMPGPSEDPAAFQRIRARILRSATRMERLAGLLMDVTRVQAALGIPISPQPTDLHDLVAHVVDEARSEHRGCVIEHRREGDGHGELDDDRVAQVVANLLGNALKYSPPARRWRSPAQVSTARSRSTSTMTASSSRTSCRTSSSPSGRESRTRRGSASDWASTSPASSWRRTEAPSRSGRARNRAPASG